MKSEARKRILFVDDEASIRLTLSPVLEQAGYEVQVAETVSDAMFEINSRTFDVLISDLNIGEEGDGFLVTSAMRQVQPDCVTFILTGYPAFETALQAIHSQVDDYLVKPVEIEALLTSVRNKLAKTSKQRVYYKELSSLLKEHEHAQMASREGISGKRETSGRDQALSQFVQGLIEVLENRRATLDTETLQAAAAYGRARKREGVSPSMLAEEFSSFQEEIYKLLQNNLEGISAGLLLSDLRRFHFALSQLMAKAIEGLCDRSGSKASST